MKAFFGLIICAGIALPFLERLESRSSLSTHDDKDTGAFIGIGIFGEVCSWLT